MVTTRLLYLNHRFPYSEWHVALGWILETHGARLSVLLDDKPHGSFEKESSSVVDSRTSEVEQAAPEPRRS